MKFEKGCFYKYVEGLSTEFIPGTVYLCKEAQPTGNNFWYIELVDDSGTEYYINTPENCFVKSGMDLKNWETRNNTAKRNVQHSPIPLEKVNHPRHYTWLKDLCGIEVIDITRHMDFDLGNAIKYILRCGHKPEEGYTEKEKMIEDLRKAVFYINDKIEQLQK